MALIPPCPQAGDTIGILSTARKISREELAPAIALLEGKGFKVRLGETIGKEANQFAGTDAERAADLQRMLDDPSVKAILCARGGYGTVRLFNLVNFDPFIRRPKWIIGYSDVTVLHSRLHRFGIESLHAVMPIHFPKDGSPNQAVNTLLQALTGEPLSYVTTAHPLNKAGKASAPLVGGNLSILYSLRGTPADLDVEDKILFLEDIDEYLYHIDRMMMNLKLGGGLSRLAGLVVGGFTDMKDNTVPYGKKAEEIILEHCGAYGYPICFGFPAGHQADNRALIMGRTAELNVSKGGATLTFATAGL